MMDGTLPPFRPRGPAALMAMAFTGADLLPHRLELLDRYIFEPGNAEALMELALVEQIFGNLDEGLRIQDEALQLCQLYRSPAASARPGLRLLAFAGAGDLGANIPLEFLIAGGDVELHTLYIVPGQPLPERVPDHDVAIVTLGQSDAGAAALSVLAEIVPQWPRPVLNRPDQIAGLSRERLGPVLDGIPGLVVPAARRISRDELRRRDLEFPLIVRPVDSHAGRGLERLDTPEAAARYLAIQADAAFHLAPYVDYRSADGVFRKYRIAFIAGTPYPVHMASRDEWRIWYVNAGMAESAAKRAEEAEFLTDFAFGRRHGAALDALARRIDLAYFGIDCAETRDGALLVFEADIAQVVHDMDPPDLFPYKPPAMRRLFTAFRAMLAAGAAG